VVARNVRPIEIWFYQTPSAALPPYFNLMFYKRSIGEDYTLYSPNQDGPARLVSTLEALNDQKKSLETLRKSLGDEVAKTSLSLIPSEHVNLDDYQVSLSSDLLMSTIAGLPDNPITQEQLMANRLREHVTTSIMIGNQDATIGTAVFRDEQGKETASYMLSSPLPDARIVGSRPDGSFYYDLALRTTVLTADSKPVYEQEDLLTGKLTQVQADIAKKKRFAAEARLPLAPGTYTIVATLTNNVNHIASRQHVSLTVPAIKSQSLGISDLLEYSAPAAVPDPASQLPFSLSKLRFTPRGAQNAIVRAGDKLPLVFQLWMDPKAEAASGPEKVHLHYVFGAVTASRESTTEENEDVEVDNRDKAGNLVTGHKVDTSNLTVGTYRLVVTATKEGVRQPAYAAMTLHVVREADFADSWTAYGPVEPGGVALDELKRGLSAEAQGVDAVAQGFYAKALAEGAPDTRAFDKLAALLERHGQNDDLAALSQQPVVTATAVDPKTLLAISQALTKTGNPKGVVKMLETQIKLQQPSAALYRALADACEATGNGSRARDLRSLATGVN
jgi:hypothetical protein